MTTEKKGIEVQQASLPKGGGAIQGMGEAFQPDEFQGGAQLNVPLPLTSCRGFTPSHQLTYHTNNGNGLWGMGWSLDLPMIMRKTNKGLPRYTSEDTFLFNGMDLVLAEKYPSLNKTIQDQTYTVTTYASRHQSGFKLIEYWVPETGLISGSFWQVVSSDNTVSVYGYRMQAKLADPANVEHVFSWLLEECYDSKGNHQLFFYKAEDGVNVPETVYEQARSLANKYIQSICYGNVTPLSDSMLFSQDDAIDDKSQWHFEVVFDYGEYDSNPDNANPYQPVQAWQCERPDVFSNYTAGFELRTYRRCRQTLLFHRFAELGEQPVLVKALNYNYQETEYSQLSQLISVVIVGYQYNAQYAAQNKPPYTTANLPSPVFSYQTFTPDTGGFEPLTQTNGHFLAGLTQQPYTLVDLYGEGIPGILYADEINTTYQSPSLAYDNYVPSQVGYSQARTCDNFPINRVIANDEVMLTDVSGNAQLDLVVHNQALRGYYEAMPDANWQAFQIFDSFPQDYTPDQVFIDITGNGLNDMVQVEQDAVRVYPSLGKQGFGRSYKVSHAQDFPVVLEKTAQRWTAFTDMSGGGTPALVEIEQNQLRYWPSLGYGEFAAPVTMANVPDFGETFDTNRLFLVDIDGSGTTDLVYVDADKVKVYFNQSGNQFADVFTIDFPFTFDNLDQVSFADVYGRGTQCLIISALHESPHPEYGCYDFCQRQKPYLLNGLDNQLGATTQITYASSVDYYLKDKQAGNAWVTALPFPVHVVAQMMHVDAISQTQVVSQYSYHHGYYDGDERQFNGFGRVERIDTEELVAIDDEAQSAPPSLTKTWYHTGTFRQSDALLAQYEKEYWQGDEQSYDLTPITLNYLAEKPTEEDQRLMTTALQGNALRSEVYGLDGSDWQALPYSMTQSRIQINQLQVKGDNLYCISFSYKPETLTYNYERNADDPLCGHHLILAIDEYAHVTDACQIAYGRRKLPDNAEGLYQAAEQTNAQQQTRRFAYQHTDYINQAEREAYLLGVSTQEQRYEILGIEPAQGLYFSWDELSAKLQANTLTSNSNLLGWSRDYYYDSDAEKELAWGEFTTQLLHCRSEAVAFLEETVPAILSTELQAAENGYQYDEINKCYWNPGGFQSYTTLTNFCLPNYYCDALHYTDWQLPQDQRVMTQYHYDNYNLILTEVIDPLGHRVYCPVEAIDYQQIHPTQMIDSNNNTSEVLFDPLGRVIVSSHYGSEGDEAVGFSSLADYQVKTITSIDEIVNNPADYLQGAASFIITMCLLGRLIKRR